MPKIKKRADGRYARQIYLGIDPTTQKRRYKTIYAATAKEADKLAAEYRAAMGHGLDPGQAGCTFRALAQNYLLAKKAEGVGASWAKTLEAYINHLSPLWSLEADKVRAAHIQAILNGLADWHEGKRPLSHKTLGQILGTCSAIFELAIPEVLQYNPCGKVMVPAGKPSEQREALDDIQQQWVINTPHRAQRAAMLMMYSGLRRGEATALTWGDIDLERGTIHVNKSMDFDGRSIKLPKTAAGIRTVHIPQLLTDFLRTERASEKPMCLYVLHTVDGRMLTEQAWKKLWRSYMLDLNSFYGHGGASKFTPGGLPLQIKTFTVHQLRHTFCTLLYLAGVDALTARDQMGHSSIQTTLNIYTHLDKKYKRHSMDKLNAYLNPCKSDASQTAPSNGLIAP